MNMVNAKEALQISKDAGWQEVLNVLITDAARAGLTVVTVTPGLHSEFKGVEQARVYNKLLMMGFGISPVGKTGFEIRWG